MDDHITEDTILQAPPKTASIDEIIDLYKPKAEDFVIVLPEGEPLIFRMPKSYADITAMHKRAGEFAEAVDAVNAGPMAEFSDLGAKTLAYAAIIAEMSVEPKISQKQACNMALRAGGLFQYLLAKIIDRTSLAHEVEMAQGVDAAKKDSGNPSITETA